MKSNVVSDPSPLSAPASNEPRQEQPVEATILAFVAIIAATALVAALGGLVSAGQSDPWYQKLDKAPGTPPGLSLALSGRSSIR
jgi:hypothetical protein